MELEYIEEEIMMQKYYEYIEKVESPFLLSITDNDRFIIDGICNSKYNKEFDKWNVNFPIYSIAKRLQQRYKITDKQKYWLVVNFNKYFKEEQPKLYDELRYNFEIAYFSNKKYTKQIP